jgi:methylenetetrahydrofolate--tRNA-(uracil-5-)-methyltransferase
MDLPPPETALGALIGHITGGHIGDENAKLRSFQPMNVNFGLFPPVTLTKPDGVKRWRGHEKAEAKKRAITSRALTALDRWISSQPE